MRNKYQAQQRTHTVVSTNTKSQQITTGKYKATEATETNLIPLGDRKTKQILIDTTSSKIDKGKQKESDYILTHIPTQNSFTALEHNPWKGTPSHKNV